MKCSQELSSCVWGICDLGKRVSWSPKLCIMQGFALKMREDQSHDTFWKVARTCSYALFAVCRRAECTAVAAIQLRMRMQILPRPENPLANFRHQISNKKMRNQVLRRHSLALIECFRGRHRGGRNFTSFLRFSGPFFHAVK